MSGKKRKLATGCCGEKSRGQICHCDKRFCLPILGLVGLAIVASLVVGKRRPK
jgi:hypothetical protein